MKKITKAQVKKYFKMLEQAEAEFYEEVSYIEGLMEQETGIEGCEFFCCDGAYCGIGDAARTMPLIHREG